MSHHDPTFWLLARSAGLSAYVLLTLSVLAGLTLRSRPSPRLRAPLVAELHKTLAVSGLAALALHGVALVLDSTVKVTPAALVVPALVSYRPAAVAVGVVGGGLFGTVILEQIFSIQGIGQFFFNSVLTADLPVVEFLVLYTSLVVILLNLAVDLSYALIDPRVKYT